MVVSISILLPDVWIKLTNKFVNIFNILWENGTLSQQCLDAGKANFCWEPMSVPVSSMLAVCTRDEPSDTLSACRDHHHNGKVQYHIVLLNIGRPCGVPIEKIVDFVPISTAQALNSCILIVISVTLSQNVLVINKRRSASVRYEACITYSIIIISKLAC